MDNINKVRLCLPNLYNTLARHQGALEALIEDALEEIDNYDLDDDVIDFLETREVTESEGKAWFEDESRGVVYWDPASQQWEQD